MQLASVPDVAETVTSTAISIATDKIPSETAEKTENTPATGATENIASNAGDQIENETSEPRGVRACEDARFKKFFKMVQFGVPNEAVKMKMKAEGIEPSILE